MFFQYDTSFVTGYSPPSIFPRLCLPEVNRRHLYTDTEHRMALKNVPVSVKQLHGGISTKGRTGRSKGEKGMRRKGHEWFLNNCTFEPEFETKDFLSPF